MVSPSEVCRGCMWICVCDSWAQSPDLVVFSPPVSTKTRPPVGRVFVFVRLLQMHQGHFVTFWFKESDLKIVILAEFELLAQFAFSAESRIMHESRYSFFYGH